MGESQIDRAVSKSWSTCFKKPPSIQIQKNSGNIFYLWEFKQILRKEFPRKERKKITAKSFVLWFLVPIKNILIR